MIVPRPPEDSSICEGLLWVSTGSPWLLTLNTFESHTTLTFGSTSKLGVWQRARGKLTDRREEEPRGGVGDHNDNVSVPCCFHLRLSWR